MTGAAVLCAALAALAGLAVLAWPAGSARAAGSGVLLRPAGGHRDDRPDDPAATPHDVADALVLLAVALRSGIGQYEALECVGRLSDGQVRDQVRAVAAALRWGRTSSEAWRLTGAVWRPVAVAWQVAAASGAGPAELTEDAARRVREREDRRTEAATARAGVLLVLPLGLAFLPSFACTTVIPVVLALARTVLGP